MVIAFEVETNAVFAKLPAPLAAALHDRGWQFYEFPVVQAWRFMCTWCTKPEGVRRLIDDVQEIAKEN